MPGSADETGAAGYRPLLFSIAYGMTGSVGEDEDIVQDAFLGLTRARQAGTTITDPKAYLTTVVSRLGINYLRSARGWIRGMRPGLRLMPRAGEFHTGHRPNQPGGPARARPPAPEALRRESTGKGVPDVTRLRDPRA